MLLYERGITWRVFVQDQYIFKRSKFRKKMGIISSIFNYGSLEFRQNKLINSI